MASNAVGALTGLLPQRSEELAANLRTTLAAIEATDRAVRGALAKTSVRTWVAYHPSWRYFADEYGLTLLAIEADGKAPSARRLAEVMGQARAAGVRVVFAEPQFDKRSGRRWRPHRRS
jgi:zinc transport system substrate-binding protein